MQRASVGVTKQAVRQSMALRLHSTGSHRHSAAPKTITGIEYAEALKKLGGGKPNWTNYKCSDYLKMNTYSYYDSEVTMLKDRVPQPTNKKPDVAPSMRK